ncbi:MAG: DUF814 domain-containing protein [Bacteroidia bacterium]
MKDLILSHFTTWHFVQKAKPFLVGSELIDAYAVSKEQTVFVLENKGKIAHLIFYFSGYNAFFWWQEEYGKPRSKYNTKYKSFFGEQVSDIVFFEKERSFALIFDEHAIFFGLFGRSNFIQKVDLPSSDVWKIDLPNLGAKEFKESTEPCLDKDFIKMVYGKAATEDLIETKQSAIQKGDFTISKNDKDKLIFGFNEPNAIIQTRDIYEALKFYSKTWFKTFHFDHTYQKLFKHFSAEKKKIEKSMTAAEKQMERVNKDLNYRLWADLLMANLHSLKAGGKKVNVLDFTGENEIEIPLKKNLNIQENAAQYYRKAKNQGKELEILEKRLERHFENLEITEAHLLRLETTNDIKSLTSFEKEIFNQEKQGEKQKQFIEFEIGGYKVYVGRNSKNNDELTLGFAGKNDLWLHAKDLAGSHVVIRNQGSQTTYPKHVIEQVASIAAHYSKGRNQEFCPVLYTLKKYIRKPKGAAAGAVLVDREDVVLVKPELPG